jgi:hypothetical protein
MSAAGSTAASISAAYPKMASYADEIVRVSSGVGIHPSWLANVIHFESGGNPQARNPYSSATGLIQFIKSTASRLGTSVDALYGMTGREQMSYVERYFAPYKGRLTTQEDVYMAVFYPKAIGNPDYRFPASVTAVNPGISTPRDYVEKANRKAALAPYVGEVVAGGLLAAYGAAPYLLLISASLVAGALIWRRRVGPGSR